LVFTRCGQVWSLDARRARRTAEARGRGEEPRDRTGPALWGVLGVLLLVATLAGRMDGELVVPVLLWTVWAAEGVWWLTGRGGRGARGGPAGPDRTRALGCARLPAAGGDAGGADGRRAVRPGAAVDRVGGPGPVVADGPPGRERATADPARRHRQHRAQRCAVRDHGRGVSDLRHGRLVQGPGLALAGRHRGLLPAAAGVLLALARARGPALRRRHPGHAGRLRDGGRAGRLPVHAVQPTGEERPAGRHDHRARRDRGRPGAAVLLPGDDRRRRRLPADVLPAPPGPRGDGAAGAAGTPVAARPSPP